MIERSISSNETIEAIADVIKYKFSDQKEFNIQLLDQYPFKERLLVMTSHRLLLFNKENVMSDLNIDIQ